MIFFYVMTNDYFLMLEVRDQVNFKIHEIVEKHGSEFGLPAQNIYLRNPEKFSENGNWHSHNNNNN